MYDLRNERERNGDTEYDCYWDNLYIGQARYNPRVTQWHGVVTIKGKLKSRHYGTKAGCLNWLKRQHS